jgi:uncharacterized protein YukE
VHPDL